jgi:Ca2+-binding RTX toxin-like protein
MMDLIHDTIGVGGYVFSGTYRDGATIVLPQGIKARMAAGGSTVDLADSSQLLSRPSMGAVVAVVRRLANQRGL